MRVQLSAVSSQLQMAQHLEPLATAGGELQISVLPYLNWTLSTNFFESVIHLMLAEVLQIIQYILQLLYFMSLKKANVKPLLEKNNLDVSALNFSDLAVQLLTLLITTYYHINLHTWLETTGCHSFLR